MKKKAGAKLFSVALEVNKLNGGPPFVRPSVASKLLCKNGKKLLLCPSLFFFFHMFAEKCWYFTLGMLHDFFVAAKIQKERLVHELL